MLFKGGNDFWGLGKHRIKKRHRILFLSLMQRHIKYPVAHMAARSPIAWDQNGKNKNVKKIFFHCISLI